MNGQLPAQAATMAYDDVFWMLTIAFVVFIPLVLLLRPRGRGAPGGGMAAH